MGTYVDNSFSIGQTPLIKLNNVIDDKTVTVLAKIEGRNPASSVKCRIASAMVWDAEKRGMLKENVEIIEPTSGNTGIGLAFVGAARGYKVNLVMPDTMSIERLKLLELLGAQLILTDGTKGMKGAVEKAQEIQKNIPERYLLLQQFENPANPRIHEKSTGPEIWEDTNGKIDAFVSGIGTGGTISGVSRFIKQTKKHPLLSVGVEPVGSPVISQQLNGRPQKPGPHMIQGIGAGFIPKNLDISLEDKMIQIDNDEASAYARRIMTEEGILCGISSGAAVCAVNKLISQDDFSGKTIVVLLPDSGERYLSIFIQK